ncbi:hypothetical protein F5B21DRAFT_518627 [Xylaria acuta]|nr:hypothetical protein F5B21DRAFT_518627 [Xylaria acuta]
MHIPPIAGSTVEADVTRHPRPSCSPEQQRLQRPEWEDVVYFGTLPRWPYHNTAVSAFRCPAIDSNQPLDIYIYLSKMQHPQKERQTGSVGRFRRKAEVERSGRQTTYPQVRAEVFRRLVAKF